MGYTSELDINKVDWDGLEHSFSDAKADCIPVNAREWTKFKRQYRCMWDFMHGLPDTDPSMEWSGLNYDWSALIHKLLDGGEDYKRSPRELVADIGVNDSAVDVLRQHGVDYQLMLQATAFFFNMSNGSSVAKSGVTAEGKLLKNYPARMYGTFDVSGLNLKTFEGCPKMIINGGFIASQNDITDLTGGPEYVDSAYRIEGCEHLTSLKGLAKTIGGQLNISKCKNLTDINALRDANPYMIVNIKDTQFVGDGGGIVTVAELKELGLLESARAKRILSTFQEFKNKNLK